MCSGSQRGVPMWANTNLFNTETKGNYMSTYESNASSSSHSLGHKARNSPFSKVNDTLHEWYLLACSKNIYPDGPILKEKAKEIAEKLGIEGFKASNGWLDKWKQRHSIKRVSICGESGDVSGATVDSWKERLPENLNGYKMEDIYNLDETGCFWRSLPDKGFGEKGKQCKGGKKSKLRVTIAFIVSAQGEKEDPIVIWTSERPRCFRGLDVSSLPVTYFQQKKAWMTGDIMNKILSSFNRKMIHQKRSVLLLMDNAGCHPQNLIDKYSNVKVIFFPPNTTSKLQPLDLGIIQNFKVHYRQFLLRYILASIETCTSASEIAGTITILNAMRWISKAWKEVKPETIYKCFKKAGISPSAIATSVSVTAGSGDPFEEIESEMDLSELISGVMGSSEKCSSDVYINGDNELSTCAEFDDESWDQTFIESLTEQIQTDIPQTLEDSETDILPPPSKIQSCGEALRLLKDVQTFLESRSAFDEASLTSTLIDQIAVMSTFKKRQSTLDYFYDID